MCRSCMAWCYSCLFYWSADAYAQRARGTVQGALVRLRQSQREIAGSIEQKRRRIRDFDRAIMEIGLRWRRERNASTATGTGPVLAEQAAAAAAAAGPQSKKQRPTLCKQDRAALTNELRRKSLYLLRIERFYDLLGTVEQQIGLLEDARTLQTSIAAIRTGAGAHDVVTQAGQMRPEDVENILERVSEQQALAADTSQLIATVNEEMQGLLGASDDALEEELQHLMDSDEFTRQFDPEDIVHAQRALAAAAAPHPPPEDPVITHMTKEARRTVDDMMVTLPETL